MAVRSRIWRPDIADVERLSRGQAAKHRGSGSRRIPHRLNQEERTLYELAKEKGFLSLRGSGYRPERKGYPLNNTWRQTCDSLSRPCVVVCLDLLGSNDTMVVDMATLRRPQGDLLEQRKQEITDLAASHDVQLINEEVNIEEQRSLLPFNFIPLEDDLESVDFSGPTRSRSKTNGRKAAATTRRHSVDLKSYGASSSYEGEAEDENERVPSSDPGLSLDELRGQVEKLNLLVEGQKERVRVKKHQASSRLPDPDPTSINSDPEVKAEVMLLLNFKRELEKAEDSYSSLRDRNEAMERRRSSSQSMMSLYNLFEEPSGADAPHQAPLVSPSHTVESLEDDAEEEEVKGDESEVDLTLMASTWQLEPIPLLFRGDGTKLKRLARSIVQSADANSL